MAKESDSLALLSVIQLSAEQLNNRKQTAINLKWANSHAQAVNDDVLKHGIVNYIFRMAFQMTAWYKVQFEHQKK